MNSEEKIRLLANGVRFGIKTMSNDDLKLLEGICKGEE
jgi:hypothetical protein